MAEEAESLAEAKDLDALKELFPHLEAAYQSACGVLRNLLEGMEE
jgi:hypothetical protein